MPSSFASFQSFLPSIGITKRRLKRLETIQLVREERARGKQELAYHTRPFVLCGIPLRRPPQHLLSYTRRNGKLFLDITGHPRFGLPFGQDRLIPIWVATLAVQQKSRVVHFDSAARMLDFFHMSKDGRHYRRIVQGFQRIFAATIFFGSEDNPSGDRILDWARFHFFDHMQLWFTGHQQEQSAAQEKFENAITLSEAFYNEIDCHRIPVEREVVATLAHAPGVLDFYIWLVWKTWTVRGSPVRIPLFGASGLCEQLGSKHYTLDRAFRLTLTRWLRVVKAIWPACPAVLSDDGQMLLIRSSHPSPAIRASR
ncbi:MAG: replication protein RepA [Terriglobia bacterium]